MMPTTMSEPPSKANDHGGMVMKCVILGFLLTMISMSIFAESDIRKGDFKNFTYLPHCAGEETQKLTVKNGEYSMEKKMQDYVDRLYFNIFAVSYGDLDGDKSDEAS